MEAIAITLNGSPVSGRPGMTILELAREVGIRIPTLCHDPSLKPVGACRMCLVEEEKSGRLLASCVTPIAAGMVINTDSAAVVEARKVIVKLMLASHPESCLLCDKGNRCQLRKIAAELGIGSVNYDRMPHFTGTQEVNPFISRDLSKCILCGKCIRADQELVVVGALDYLDRGFDAKPATTFDGPLESSECTFCGTCVSMCPTGALSERGKAHLGTISKRTESVCSYCGCGCGIFLETGEGRVVSVSPNPADTVNGKTLCVKGRYGSDYIHHPDRLMKPMIRKDGSLQEVGWDEALDFAAEGLMGCLSRHGPEGMAFFGSSKCANEENYLFQKIARAVFGANNIDSGARLHSGPSVDTLPFGAATNPFRDIERSDLVIVIGSDPSASHPVAGYAIKRAVHLHGAKLIVLDPRKTGLVSMASAWLPIRPGTDGIFLNGLLGGLLDSRTPDKDIIGARPAEVSALRDSLAMFDRKYIEQWTGCPPSLFEKILKLVLDAKLPAIVYGHGITRQANAREAIRAVMNLALLKDSLGKTGGGVYPLDKENNGQGAWDMGIMPDRLPGHQSLDDERAVERFEKHWGRPIPKKPGLDAVAMIEGARAGSLKAMYVMGENPLRAFPDPAGIEKALSNLEFLVVQDLFLTETANLAHAVLPACSFAEKDGTFTSIERRVQRVRKAVEPSGQSLPDWEILCRLSERLGYPMKYGSAGAIMEEIAGLAPLYSEISPERIGGGGTFWPCRDDSPESRGRLSVKDWGEKAKLSPAQVQPGSTGQEEGFVLVRGSSLFHFLGGARSTRSRRLGAIKAPGYVEMNPSDARGLDLREGDSVRLFSDSAEVLMTVALSDSLPAGMLFCPYFDRIPASLTALSPGPGGMNTCRVTLKKEG
ncbi:MAG: molybdopterin-dependent oxidoreductase [Syntrophobacteraceae bacterium]